MRGEYALGERQNSGECRLFWILVHRGPRRCVGPRGISARASPSRQRTRGAAERRTHGSRLDVQVCDQDEPADDGLVPDAGFARTRAANPNELWVTDITESGIPAGKVYLPPVIDRYDGMPSPERACYRCERPFRQRSPTKRHRPLAIRDTPSYRKCREGSESGPSRHFAI